MKRPRDRRDVTQHYAKLAPEYDTRWSYYVRATTDATLQRLPERLGDVLDIGCGTGALLVRLREWGTATQLTGVDASAEMLAIARERLPAEVSLHECWAEALPFEDDTFDTITSCNMFHFIRHPTAALKEMLRVLRPGGALVITDWCDDYLTCKLCDFYLRWFDPSHYRMYGSTECRAMLEAAKAHQVTIDKYKISILWGLMTATGFKPTTADSAETLSPLSGAT